MRQGKVGPCLLWGSPGTRTSEQVPQHGGPETAGVQHWLEFWVHRNVQIHRQQNLRSGLSGGALPPLLWHPHFLPQRVRSAQAMGPRLLLSIQGGQLSFLRTASHQGKKCQTSFSAVGQDEDTWLNGRGDKGKLLQREGLRVSQHC